MFSKVLLIDKEVVVFITWLGFGQMRVIDLTSGKLTIVRKDNKAHFLAVCHELSKLGVPLSASNDHFRSFVRQFAEVISLGQDDLLMRTARNIGPKAQALGILASED